MRADHPPMIYIAGPLGAPTPLEVRRNIERARDVAHTVARYGGYPITPHMNTGEFYGTLAEDSLWLPGTMELLHRCDAIVCLNTWRASKGAQAEREWAVSVGMPVHEFAEEGQHDSPTDRLYEFIQYLRGRQRDGIDYLHWSRWRP